VSGFLAGVAGCLLTMIGQQYSETPYTADQSVAVFTASVVGGVGSLAGAVIGAIFLKGGTWFLPSSWQLLPSAIGVLGVLLLLPGGLAELAMRLRDGFAVRLAIRRSITLPSMRGERFGDAEQSEVALPDLAEMPDLAETGADER
jgi:branched-chain amino acid transport system permease protein